MIINSIPYNQNFSQQKDYFYYHFNYLKLFFFKAREKFYFMNNYAIYEL